MALRSAVVEAGSRAGGVGRAEVVKDLANCLHDLGMLHVLVLAVDHGAVTGLSIEKLGQVSQPTAISYITSGVAFIGSSFGDSQLVQLNTEPDPTTGAYLTELERWPSLGPIAGVCPRSRMPLAHQWGGPLGW